VSTPTSVDGDFLEYRIEEPLGHGGMGVVYLAQDVRLKRKVALKLMAPELALDQRYRARFERESELAMSLEHPNVVPIHDAGEAEGRLYLAMRCVEGTDLRAQLRKEGALAPHRALAIVSQIAHALDAAHAKGLVHRDVKPSNVLLDETEHVYLADFGLTRRLSDPDALRGDTLSLGTPAYLAPEQIEGGPVDGRADVYSLGCLLYECLTGEPPFAAGSRLAVAWAHLEQEPPLATERKPALPAAIDGVIRKAMAKQPEDRYPTCGELVAAATEALGITRPGAGRRRLLVAGAVTVAVLTAVVVALFGRGQSPAADLAVRANTLVRIDPAKNAIDDVIDVGRKPNDTAVGGDSVWAYNVGDNTVTEVDPKTDEVRHTTAIPTVATDVTLGNGPLLAADSGGAWVIGYDLEGQRYLLTRVYSRGRGRREYSFGMQLNAVVTTDRAVWVLAKGDRSGFVLGIDPRSGRVVVRRPVPAWMFGVEGQGLAVGGGFAWVTNASAATVYRLDVRTGKARYAKFGGFVTRPVFGFGRLWLCSWDGRRGSMIRINPQTLHNEFAREALPAEEGHFAVGYGSLWRHDSPSGTLMRFRPRTGDPAGLVPVLKKPQQSPQVLAVTSIATGAGGVWLTIGGA
jgi:serine/threonine-protein kinase